MTQSIMTIKSILETLKKRNWRNVVHLPHGEEEIEPKVKNSPK
jgi:hypothetical protein